MTNKELIGRIFKEPSNKFNLTEFERGGGHATPTMMLAGDIQCGDAAENSKTT